MSVEIEAKMQVPSHEPLRARLVECGASRLGHWLETNLFFDSANRALVASDQGLRLRKNQDLASGSVQYILTYKGRRQRGPLKRREEIEVSVDQADSTVALLERLGYLRMMSFQKRRESWSLEKCRVELDEVPLLGLFVEIEGPDEAVISHVCQRLDLSGLPLLQSSYIALLQDLLQHQGSEQRDVVFPRGSAMQRDR